MQSYIHLLIFRRPSLIRKQSGTNYGNVPSGNPMLHSEFAFNPLLCRGMSCSHSSARQYKTGKCCAVNHRAGTGHAAHSSEIMCHASAATGPAGVCHAINQSFTAIFISPDSNYRCVCKNCIRLNTWNIYALSNRSTEFASQL